MEDIAQLKEEILQLKEEKRNNQANLHRAGQLGNQLLETNSELERKVEILHKDYSKKIEALEQEKYSLQLKLENVKGEHSAHVADLEMQKHDEVTQERQLNEQLQIEYARKLKTLTDQNRDLKTSLEEAALLEQQLQYKVEQQKQLLFEAQSQRRDPDVLASGGDDVLAEQLKLEQLQEDKMKLSLQLQDSQDTVRQQRFSLDKMQETTAALKQELEETERKATGYYNALEKSREDILGLEAQIEALKLQSVDPNSRGNSLFAEVEDRRVAVEKKMITLQVQHESLKKQHMATKQLLLKLKAQFAALLQMGSGRADASQVQRLEQALSQSRAEAQVLSNKLRATERQLQLVDDNPRRTFEQYQSNFTELGGRKDYAAFLEDRLKESKEETKKVSAQLDQQKFLQMADKDRLLHCERKLYEAESRAESLQGQNMKLLVQLEDMKLKYQPELLDSTKIRTGRLEKIPMGKSKEKTAEKASISWSTAGTGGGDSMVTGAETAVKTTGNACSTRDSTDPTAEQAPNTTVDSADITTGVNKANSSNTGCGVPCVGGRGEEEENSHMNNGSQYCSREGKAAHKEVEKQNEMKEEPSMEADEPVSSRKVRFEGPVLAEIGRRNYDSDDDDDDGTARVKRPIGRGRKSHKVVHVSSEGRPECKQQ